jgi:hemerythrin
MGYDRASVIGSEAMLLWSEQFETGQPVIDAQHKKLIAYINRLEGVSGNTNPSRQEAEFVLELVDFIETYTVVHFQFEEACMLKHRCPSHQDNKEAHRKFLETFRAFRHRVQIEGFRTDVLKELHETCAVWIQDHILQMDTQIKPCIRSDGQGK